MRAYKWLTTALALLLCATLASPNLMPGDYHSQMEGTTCNIQKPTQNCDQREMRYVLRLRSLSKEKRYEMYKSMFDLTHVDRHQHVRESHFSPDHPSWHLHEGLRVINRHSPCPEHDKLPTPLTQVFTQSRCLSLNHPLSHLHLP